MQSLSIFDLRFSPSNGESMINIARQNGRFHIYSVFICFNFFSLYTLSSKCWNDSKHSINTTPCLLLLKVVQIRLHLVFPGQQFFFHL